MPVLPSEELVDGFGPVDPLSRRTHDLAVPEADVQVAWPRLHAERAAEAGEMADLQDTRRAHHLQVPLHRGRARRAPQREVALQDHLDPDEQLADRSLLREEVVRSQLQAEVARLVVVEAGEEQERRLADQA